MEIYNKAKWVLGILLIFAVIAATNLIDKGNFIRVKDSVVTMYKDRLIANDLIFEMSQLFQEKEMALALSDSLYFDKRNKKVNTDIQVYISQYENTFLTDDEKKLFSDLKESFIGLCKSEENLVVSQPLNNSGWQNHMGEVRSTLSALSKIQLNEGKRQMGISTKAIESVELFTQMEIYLLIVLAILIQLIVMYKPK